MHKWHHQGGDIKRLHDDRGRGCLNWPKKGLGHLCTAPNTYCRQYQGNTKKTFSGRRPLLEDDLRWKTTCGGRRPSFDPCMLPTLLCGIFVLPKHFKCPFTFGKNLKIQAPPSSQKFQIFNFGFYHFWRWSPLPPWGLFPFLGTFFSKASLSETRCSLNQKYMPC